MSASASVHRISGVDKYLEYELKIVRLRATAHTGGLLHTLFQPFASGHCGCRGAAGDPHTMEGRGCYCGSGRGRGFAAWAAHSAGWQLLVAAGLPGWCGPRPPVAWSRHQMTGFASKVYMVLQVRQGITQRS